MFLRTLHCRTWARCVLCFMREGTHAACGALNFSNMMTTYVGRDDGEKSFRRCPQPYRPRPCRRHGIKGR